MSPPSVAPNASLTSGQRSLVFETDQRGRDETALLHALNKAFTVLLRSGGQESALQESFVHAMTGLGAEKGTAKAGPRPKARPKVATAAIQSLPKP